MIADLLRIVGVCLLLSTLVLLVSGQSAGDCLVVAVVGLGLVQVGAS